MDRDEIIEFVEQIEEELRNIVSDDDEAINQVNDIADWIMKVLKNI